MNRTESLRAPTDRPASVSASSNINNSTAAPHRRFLTPEDAAAFPGGLNANFEPLLTAQEAAEHLRVHVKTLQKLAREDRVPCIRLGKYWLFRLSSLDEWVTGQQNRTSQSFA